MTNQLDKILAAQEEKLKQQKNSTFWSRNKKVIITIGIILLIMWVFAIGYTYYWLPRIYETVSQ